MCTYLFIVIYRVTHIHTYTYEDWRENVWRDIGEDLEIKMGKI